MLRIQQKYVVTGYILKILLVCLAILLSMLYVWTINPTHASEQTDDWLSVSHPPTLTVNEPIKGEGYCYPNTYRIQKLDWGSNEEYRCVTVGSKLDATTVAKPYYLGSKSDKLHFLKNGMFSMTLFRGTDVGVSNTKRGLPGPAPYINVYTHLSDSLITKSYHGGGYEYELDSSKVSYPTDGRKIEVETAGVSSNGKYLIYSQVAPDSTQLQYVVVNLDDESERIIGFADNDAFNGSRVPTVSPDGRYAIAIVGDESLKIWALSDCFLGARASVDSCPAREINLWYDYDISGQLLNDSIVTFKNDELELKYAKGYYNSAYYSLSLRPSNYFASKLDYLALGDSYSSGEGDTTDSSKGKHYRAGTDSEGPPVEKCHISTRSFPYALAEMQSIASNDWQTVACSGAEIQKDYYGSDDKYLGQGNRLGYFKNNDFLIKTYQANAQRDFIPGRNKQIEFMKEYKPLAITITGAGNDSGFGDVIKACVSPGHTTDTCDYANVPHNTYMLGQAIQQQYENIRKMLRALKTASPRTVIYYVGYPQFVASNDKKCGIPVSLSIRERVVFRDAVSYLNNVIKAAAKSEGAIYVNVEDSLGEHKLCDVEKAHVNGFNADCSTLGYIHVFAGKSNCQESFHPNADGHKAMANTINSEIDLTDTEVCNHQICNGDEPLSDVVVPKVFEVANNQEMNVNYTPTYGGDIIVGQKLNNNGGVVVGVPNLEPRSQAHVYIASTPTDVGYFTVNDDGVLNLSFGVPDSIPAGYHTLHIEASTDTGEPIDNWRIIRVIGADGDVDEDGIPDDVDNCNFMPATGIDRDGDGVDDGCDEDVTVTFDEKVDDSRSLKYVDSSSSISTTQSVKRIQQSQVQSLKGTGRGVVVRNSLTVANQMRYQRKSRDVHWFVPIIAVGCVVALSGVVFMIKSKYTYVKKEKRDEI